MRRSTQGLRPVRIAGLSTFVPPRVLTNADLEKLVNTTDEWILQRTGIRERHIAEPGVATSDLAKEAAEGAMREAGITPDQLGFIVVGTTTPDTIFPSTACMLQAKIGAPQCLGIRPGRGVFRLHLFADHGDADGGDAARTTTRWRSAPT